MAPAISHVHKLVVRNVKLLKAVWRTVQHNVSQRLAPLEPIPIRIRATQQQPLHRIAAVRQSRSGWNSNTARFFGTSARNAGSKRISRSAWPSSATRSAVERQTARAPFASTLRPNLTGGALSRTSGGYSLGSGRVGGVRHFSHTPAAPAQVVQNVSQAVRAFLLSGQKAQFAGTDARTGEKQYKAVSALQDATTCKIARLPLATPGSTVDFRVNPTITALTPLSAIVGFAGFPSSSGTDVKEHNSAANLNTSGLLDVLSVDFSRALRDLAAILNDLQALATLGDLPITYQAESSSSLRVHFPGCDAGTVENLRRELGVKRGVVTQDANFDAFAGTEIALLFPFAPSEGSEYNPDALDPRDHPVKSTMEASWTFENNLHPHSNRSEADSFLSTSDDEMYATQDENGFSTSSYLHSGLSCSASDGEPGSGSSPLEYQDFEGIYRFIELCDQARA